MARFLSVIIMLLVVTGCTVQPLTPPPIAEGTAPAREVAESPQSAATGIVATTPSPVWTATPIATAPAAASATPETLPSPTEPALAALVVNPSPAPTDVPVIVAFPPAAILLPTDTATAVPPAPVAPPPPEDAAAAEQYTIDLVNAQRAAAGVPPLQRDETLMGVARARVADMVARGYTGHDDPVTGEPLALSMMRAAGYTSSYLGENWYGSIKSPPGIVDTAMSWFMTDPPHARNILSPNYVGVGVGIAFNGQQWLLVQDFAGPNP